jgi:hypothetical protein
MRITRQFLPVLLLVLGLYSLTGCGGGTAGSLAQSLNQPGGSIDGVSSGSFKAIRYNDRGYQDTALNSTLALATTDNGATTTVTLAVHDQSAMYGAAIDLFYDAAQYSPVKTEFSGLVDTPLELASSKTTGIVALGQVDVDGVAVRDGQFAVVTFVNAPSRTISAAGDAHQTPVNQVYPVTAPTGFTASEKGFEITNATAGPGDATFDIYSTWATGDGDQNGTTNVSDLTPMVQNGYFGSAKALSATDFGTAMTDYDGNGETNASDLTKIAQHINEATTQIEVLIADNDGASASDPHTFTGTETVVQTLDFSAGVKPTRPPAAGTTDFDLLFTKWSGVVTVAQADAADVNNDNKVYLSARTKGTGAPGPLFNDATQALTVNSGPPPPPTGVVVTGFDVQVQATGGNTDFTAAGGDVTLQAGETGVTVNITGVSGTYDDGLGGGPQAFTAANQTNIPVATYNATLTSVQGLVGWQVTTQGDNTTNEYHTAQPVLSLSAASGTGVTGDVTVDSDPESTLATTPEGRLRATLLTNAPSIPADVTYDFRLDVTEDTAAPTIKNWSSLAPQEGNYLGLNAVGSTQLSGEVTLGSAPLPVDRTQIQLKLVDLTDPNSSVNLQYLASGQLSDGQFRLDENFTPMILNIQVSGVAAAGHLYGFHMILPSGAGTTTSTVNSATGTTVKQEFFKVGPPPAPVTFSTLPGADDVIGPNDTLLVMYPDPVIRRDPRMHFQGNTAVTEDSVGFNDILKTSGNEFAPSSALITGQGNVVFPKVIAIQGTDATTVTGTTQGDPTVAPIYVTPQGVVLNIAGATNGATDQDYAFKVFGAGSDPAAWPNLGTGHFKYHANGIAPSGFDAVDFGLNIFSSIGRGDLDLASRDYSDKDLNGDNAKTGQPDVLFVEFYGYSQQDFDLSNPWWGNPATPDAHSPLNTLLSFTLDTQPGHGNSITVPLMPRTAALDAQGHILASFTPTKEYFQKAGTPGWYGILNPGEQYFVTLVDQQNSNNNFEFGTELTVSGSNPNF